MCLVPDPEVTVSLNSAQLNAQLPICGALGTNAPQNSLSPTLSHPCHEERAGHLRGHTRPSPLSGALAKAAPCGRGLPVGRSRSCPCLCAAQLGLLINPQLQMRGLLMQKLRKLKFLTGTSLSTLKRLKSEQECDASECLGGDSRKAGSVRSARASLRSAWAT